MFLQHKWMTAHRIVNKSQYLLQDLPTINRPLPVNLSNKAAFLSLNLGKITVSPNEAFEVSHLGKALSPMKNDYMVFVHFINSDGQTLFQQDHQPVGGVCLTGDWRPGDMIEESYVVIVPKDTPPSNYRIRLGLWNPDDGTRFKRLSTFENVGEIIIEDFTVSLEDT